MKFNKDPNGGYRYYYNNPCQTVVFTCIIPVKFRKEFRDHLIKETECKIRFIVEDGKVKYLCQGIEKHIIGKYIYNNLNSLKEKFNIEYSEMEVISEYIDETSWKKYLKELKKSR